MLIVRFSVLCSLLASVVACSTAPVVKNNEALITRPQARQISSSSSTEAQLESYQLPITRNGRSSVRVAYKFWSGEWPEPIVDVSSDLAGFTEISVYKDLQNPRNKTRMACTVTNAVYHHWAKNPSSIKDFYTLIAREEYQAIDDVQLADDLKIKKGEEIINVLYHGENYCGATWKQGKKLTNISVPCPDLTENTALMRTTPEDKFKEQWLELTCQEKDSRGYHLHGFVQDKDLLSQKGVTQGCFKEYGVAHGGKNCEQQNDK